MRNRLYGSIKIYQLAKQAVCNSLFVLSQQLDLPVPSPELPPASCCCKFSSLVVFGDHGVVERVFVHPASLYGCHWCPGHANIIATGCQDGKVRVFDVSWTGMEPQYILSGHSKRVFHVCWCVFAYVLVPSRFGSEAPTLLTQIRVLIASVCLLENTTFAYETRFTPTERVFSAV